MKKIKDNLFPLIFLLLLLLAWEFLVPYFEVPSYILPKFSKVVKALYAQRDLLFRHSIITFLKR